MASKKRERKERAASGAAGAATIRERLANPRAVIPGLAVCTLLFYFQPLFATNATIQWDAVDVQYSAQNYLAQMLHAGKLPHWTPYVYSGVPFLADPQVGAWYPLNWPFFLLGITPRAMEWQLALHAFLAAVGGYLLARDLTKSRAAAVFAGVFFAFSGLFAETSSHVGPFQATSLLPWLLWTGRRAAHAVRWLPAVAVASGCMVLAGHFQTALYSFFGLGLFLVLDCVISGKDAARGGWRGTLAALACAAVGAASLAAVMVLPGLELTAESIRSGANYSRDAGASLVPEALVTLVNPNYYGAVDGEKYTGPQDITQFYLYMGILLLPLAAIGLAAGREKW